MALDQNAVVTLVQSPKLPLLVLADQIGPLAPTQSRRKTGTANTRMTETEMQVRFGVAQVCTFVRHMTIRIKDPVKIWLAAGIYR